MNHVNAPETRKPRSLAARIAFGVAWFIPIYLVSNMLVGAVVGGIAGASTTTYEAGYAAGQAAAAAFFSRYGALVLTCQVLATFVLSWYGLLPGTARYKRQKAAA